MRALALALLLTAPAHAAPPSCQAIATRLAELDARLDRIAENQALDTAAGYASVPISALTAGVGWVAIELATAGLETDPLAAYAEYSAYLGAGLALGCPVEMREPAKAEETTAPAMQERQTP